MAALQKPPQIICFGASISEWSFDTDKGFGRELKQKYAGKAEVKNQGYAGYFTTNLHPIYKNLITEANTPSAAPVSLITILVGANDSAIIHERGPQTPLPQFEQNIRYFVDSVIQAEYMQNTNTILIASPPLNMSPTRSGNNVTAEEIAKAKEGRGFENYISKKAFAEKVMQIAAEYEGTGRVAGLDGWKMLVDKALEAQGRSEEEEAEKYAEEKMPGCGIPGATGFPEGWYRDAIHLGPKGYEVITRGLFELILRKWPELVPENIGR